MDPTASKYSVTASASELAVCVCVCVFVEYSVVRWSGDRVEHGCYISRRHPHVSIWRPVLQQCYSWRGDIIQRHSLLLQRFALISRHHHHHHRLALLKFTTSPRAAELSNKQTYRGLFMPQISPNLRAWPHLIADLMYISYSTVTLYASYVYNGCLAWYNVVLTPRIHSSVQFVGLPLATRATVE